MVGDLDTARGQEATPIVVDGVLYVSTAWSMVKAFDAATGKPLWSYDPQVPREKLVDVCCDAVNRGVAVYKGKVFVGTLAGHVVALDAGTGKVVWDTRSIPEGSHMAITGAPRIVKGKVLIGAAGSEYFSRGYLAAFDAETGKEAWRFYTVPGDPSKPFEGKHLATAAKSWSGEYWKRGGGGTVWDSITYDPETDLVYFGTANAEPWIPASATRPRATISTPRRSSRSGPTPANTSGTSRRRRRIGGTSIPTSRSSRRTSRWAARRSASSCTRRRTASSTCSTRRPANSSRARRL